MVKLDRQPAFLAFPCQSPSLQREKPIWGLNHKEGTNSAFKEHICTCTQFQTCTDNGFCIICLCILTQLCILLREWWPPSSALVELYVNILLLLCNQLSVLWNSTMLYFGYTGLNFSIIFIVAHSTWNTRSICRLETNSLCVQTHLVNKAVSILCYNISLSLGRLKSCFAFPE